MAKATDTITLTAVRDIQSVTWYYQLKTGTSAPAKPTASPPPSPWQTTEPSYTAGDTKYLFIVERTVYTDGTFEYTTPSLSSSYEAAKQAYNEAQNAKKTATNFMSSDSSGIMVADMRNGSSQTPSNPSGRNVLIDSDSIDIRNGRDVLASFGSTAIIGQEGESRAQIDYNSLQMIDKEGNTYFLVSDLRDRSGVATVQEDFYNKSYILLTFPATEIVQITADGRTLTADEYTLNQEDGQQLTLDNRYDEITVQYTTNRIVTAYTLGSRHRAGRVGANSVAMGRQVIASGPFAVALGSGNEAHGLASLAAGVSNEALGSYSAAFGSDGCARGFASASFGFQCYANGNYSIAEGENSVADGENSHAMNEGTIAHRLSQTAIGRFNEMETGGTAVKGKYALIIGNGTSDENRSNALTVDWDGHVQAAGMAGIVQMFAGATPPPGWILCDGRALNRTTYKALFDVIGTSYGAGDGSATFNVPDLRDRMPIGAGSSYALNAKAGATTHHHTTGNFTLGVNHIPAHTHGKSGAITSGITGGSHSHTYEYKGDASSSLSGSNPDGTGSVVRRKDPTAQTGLSTAASTHTHNLPAHEHTSVGGGQAHNHGNTGDASNMPPYIGINFIICTGRIE